MTEYEKAQHLIHNRERYWFLRENGFCTKCGSGYARAGHVTCEDCSRKVRANEKRSDPDGSKHRKRMKDRNDRLKSEGICLTCGKAKAVEGRRLCEKCAEVHAESSQVYRIRQRIRREAVG